MSKQIRSIFDSMDMAEFARMRLKREGVDVESYNVRQVSEKTNDEINPGVMFYPNLDIGQTNETFWTDSVKYQPFGGVLLGTDSNRYENRTREDDIYSNEVSMTIYVPDGQVDYAEGIIRSCHGHGITIN